MKQSPHLRIKRFTSSFSIHMALVSFPCLHYSLASPSSAVLNRRGDSEHSGLAVSLRDKASVFYHWVRMVIAAPLRAQPPPQCPTLWKPEHPVKEEWGKFFQQHRDNKRAFILARMGEISETILTICLYSRKVWPQFMLPIQCRNSLKYKLS